MNDKRTQENDEHPVGEASPTETNGSQQRGAGGASRYCIPLAEGEKRPYKEFGGWSIDPEHSGVHTEAEAEAGDWPYWAIVGTEERNLLVVDIDLYEMWCPRVLLALLNLDNTFVVISPSGGLHLYFRVTDEDADPSRLESIETVDLKGEVANGYVRHPSTPGFVVWNDQEPREIDDLAAFAESFPGLDWGSETRTRRRTTGTAESIEDISAELPIDMSDVLPGVTPGRNIPHPIHGSGSGGNFGVDPALETWYCYSDRHEHNCGNVTGNAYHYVALQEGILECGEWMRGEPWAGKRAEIADACRERDIPLPPSWRDDRRSVDWPAVERTERIGFDADDPPKIDILHGSPRYDHKTTTLVEDHAEREIETTFSIVPNHELGSEQTVDHLGPGEFGIDARRVVHLKGQQRACPSDCVHHRAGDLNHGRHVHAGRRALERHDVVTPQVFVGQDDVCPHFACIVAAESARWVVLPPEMLKHVDPPDSYSVIIDEETTLNRLRPKDPGLLTFQANRTDDTPANFVSTGRPLTHDAVATVREKVQRDIDELDRVPKRYRNVSRAIDALETLNDRLDACGLGFAKDAADAIQRIEGIEVPDVELVGSTAEREAALSYVREGLRSFGASKYLEAIIAGARLNVVQSGAKYNVKLIPDLTADVLFHRRFLAGADHIGVVGNQVASWFAWQLGVDDPDVITMDGLSEIEKSRLDIVLAPGDERARRRTMDKVAAELTGHGIENLLVAGSKSRAADASDRLPAESHLAGVGTSTEAIEGIYRLDGWNVTTYMNSTVTRGIDLPMNVSICRTTQFDASVWDAHEEFAPVAEYVQATETINAMLRGAGQGERHVAVAPDDIEPFLDWDLSECVTELSGVEAIVNLVLDALTDVERDSELGTFHCGGCGTHFLDRDQFLSHGCSPAPAAAD